MTSTSRSAAVARRPRGPSGPAAGRPAAGRACGRAGSAACVGSVCGRVERAELLRAAARRRVTLRRSGGSTNGNAAMSPRPSAVICRMTEARLVRRISGSVNSGRRLEVLLGVEPDADAVGDAAAAARALVGRGLARSARSAAAAPWCGGCSGRSGRCRGRRRSGCRARSARSRRRWWRARSGGRCAAGRPGAARPRTAGRRAAAISVSRRSRRRRSASAVSRISRSPERKTRMSPGALGGQLARPRRTIASIWSRGRRLVLLVVLGGSTSGR